MLFACPVAGEIRVKLTASEEARLQKSRPVNPQAHDAYLRGRYFRRKGGLENVEKARQYFEQALDIDPLYAPAYAALADYYSVLPFYTGARRDEVLPKAKAAVTKALELDDSLAEAHSSLAYIYTYYDWDWATAERELERALLLNPNYAHGYLHYSWYLGSQGRFEESRSAILRAKELDPLSIIVHANMSNYYQFGRDYDGALVQTRKALDMAPDAPIVLLFHGMTCWAKELHEEAAAGFKKLVDLTGGGPGFKGYLAYSYAKLGQKESALVILNELTVTSKSQPVPSFQFALVMLGLDRFEEALHWLEKSFEERGSWFPHIRHECLFDPLRGYPRFQDLVRRLNFPAH